MQIQEPGKRTNCPSFSKQEAEAFMATWCRVVDEDGATFAYCPDVAAANLIAAAPDLLKALKASALQSIPCPECGKVEVAFDDTGEPFAVCDCCRYDGGWISAHIKDKVPDYVQAAIDLAEGRRP